MPQTITGLSVQKRNKGRVSVFLDGEYAFSLGLNAALALKRGQVLSLSDLECLQREDEIQRAYNQALRFLSYRPRSQVEVARNLRDKDYTAEAVEAAMERLQSQQYVDDREFVLYWLDNRDRFRPQGARALRYELRQKGVDSEVINTALADLDEDALAWAAIEGKLNRWHGLSQADFRKKAMGFLDRRGFSYGIIRSVCQKGWEMIADGAD